MSPKPKKPPSEFVTFVMEQLAFVKDLHLRSMFGGYGLFQDDRMFALIYQDQLYFKADAATRAEFQAKSLSPFTYAIRGKWVKLQYFEAPAEVFDEMDEMRFWVNKALLAAGCNEKPKNEIS